MNVSDRRLCARFLAAKRASLMLVAVFALSAAAALGGTIKLVSGDLNTEAMPKADAAALLAQAGPGGRSLTLVQFPGPIQDAWLDSLRATGARIIAYIPDNAYLVALDEASSRLAPLAKGLEWIGGLEPEFKLSPAIAGSADPTLDVTILSADESLMATLAAYGVKPQSSRKMRMGYWQTRASIPAALLPAVAKVWSVFLVEPQPVYKRQGERGAQTVAGNYLPGATAPAAPGYTTWLSTFGLTGGAGQIISIQDDGLDRGDASNLPGTAHVDIVGRIAGIFNPTADPLGDSRAGHGMINAGIIMGNAAGGSVDAGGYKLGQGVAPQAKIFATKIFRNSGPFDIGTNTFSDLAKVAQDAGCRLSSNSWGSDSGGAYTADSAEFDALTRDADEAEPGNQPMLFFFSAGNAGPGARSLGSPGSAKNVIAVGAGENSDADGIDGCLVDPSGANSIRDLIYFSSRGPASDGRFGVTLFSVGTHVQGPASTAPGYDGSGVCDQYWPIGQTLYARSSGTSHSTPLACGAGALVHELFNSQIYLLGHPQVPSPALLKAALANTATDMAGGSNGASGLLANVPNAMQGWGSLDVRTLVDMRHKLCTFDQKKVFAASGESWQKSVRRLQAGTPLKITLAWTDAPALPLSQTAQINDLDLVVTDGTSTYRGNVFASGNSTTGGSADRLNNLESVYIPNPGAGPYTITVQAFNIAGDGVPGNADLTDQDFALFVWNGNDQTSAGTIDIDKTLASCTGSIRVTVSDADLRGGASILVNVASAPSGDSETILLNEIGVATGVFSGTVDLAAGAPAVDGSVQVAHGDTVAASYNDANNGSGAAVATDTASVDCSPPGVGGVSISNVTASSFVVNFQTDEPATGEAFAASACGGAGVSAQSASGLFHSVKITGLAPCTTYRVRAEATDDIGNIGSDDNAGACYSATTLSLGAASLADTFEPAAQPGWSHAAAIGPDAWLERVAAFAHSPTHVFSYNASSQDWVDAQLATPAFQGGGVMSFWHTFAFEYGFDGGVIELSEDGGATWSDLGPEIVQGGYNGQISPSFGSVIAGRPAWTGGTLNTMTQAVVDLSNHPGPLRVRFRYAQDNIVASTAWQIDDIEVRPIEPCLANLGFVRMTQDFYGCSSSVGLEVWDLNAPAAPLPVAVTTLGGDSETVMATDPDADKVYAAALPIGIAGELVTPGDGRLQGSATDTIRAAYNDADSGGGVPATVEDLAALDCDPPTISNVAVAVGTTDEISVTFDTDEPAAGTVEGSKTCGGATATGATPMGIAHISPLGGIQTCSSFLFRVRAVDAAGNIGIDDNGGACHVASLPFSFKRLFEDGFDPAIGGPWSHSAASGADNWALRASGFAASAPNVYGMQPGPPTASLSSLESPGVDGATELSFRHAYGFETGLSANYDGGVLELFVPGTGWVDLGPYTTQGGYTGTISGQFQNPLGGRMGWTGTQSAPGLVKVDLSSFASVSIKRVRFSFGADESFPSDGWWIDDFLFSSSGPCPPNASPDWQSYE